MLAFEPFTPREANTVLAHAKALQRAVQSGSSKALLRGKNLALLCEADCVDDDGDGDADAALFRRAAVELGAHVARIRPSLSALSTPQDVQHTAMMLERLYDAIECQGLARALVLQIGQAAGVPVYHAMASKQHPTAKLVDQLSGDALPGDKRRLVLQAALLSSIV